jgi:hypothetical protein
VNRIQRAAFGIWVLWVGFSVFFPNWQQAAEREVAYRKELGLHFILTPPAPVSVPCYFVGCSTAPASYFHVLIDRRLVYEELACATALMILAVLIFRSSRYESVPFRGGRMRFVAAVLIALALPVPIAPFFPVGVLAGYMPAAVMHPDHDHVSALVGFPLFFVPYALVSYLSITLVLWAKHHHGPGRSC